MEITSYQFSESGDWILVQIPRALLVFKQSEWVRALKRGKSVIRAHNHAKRKKEKGRSGNDEKIFDQ